MQVIDEGLVTGLNETQQTLLKAKQKIEDKTNWCKNAYASDKRGIPVYADDKRAARWCAIGALKAIIGHDLNAMTALFEAGSELYGKGIAPGYVNDYLGHTAVIRMYDRAVELAANQTHLPWNRYATVIYGA